jgi:hypothetical protein
MADSSVFEQVCIELERRTDLDRLAARGTIRIALKNSGLESSSVDLAQMQIVLRRVLPAELRSRGIEGSDHLCDEIGTALAGMTFEAVADRAGAAASALARLGS